MDNQRRIFLATAGQLAGLATLAACHDSRSGSASSDAGVGNVMPASASQGAYPFSLGVASGSPLPDAVVIWTRILYDPLNAAAMPALAIPVRWEMADDEHFGRIVAKGSATATPALAHSVHVDVKGLAPGR